MTDSIDDRLRESLAALSKPVETGEAPSLVDRALAEVESGSQRTKAHGPADAPRKPWHRRMLVAGGFGAVLCLLAIAAILPSISGARRAAMPSTEYAAQMRREHEVSSSEYPPGATVVGGQIMEDGAPRFAFNALPVVPSDDPASTRAKATAGRAADSAMESAPAEQRIILRTGSCEIRVDDVAVGRSKVESLIRPDLGEYIENASVALDQSNPSATIAVRIDSARFDEFPAALSGVGTVRSVSVNAADATDQVVDLEARLRNERRVEEEVLRLLENRQDAPLEDIVRVRRELSDVRGSIERMEAQRQSILGRAELSTVRITLIGPEPKLDPGADDSPSFSHRIGEAITDGWRRCTDSVVWVAEVLVSGLVWWIAGAAIIWLAVRHHRWTSSWR